MSASPLIKSQIDVTENSAILHENNLTSVVVSLANSKQIEAYENFLKFYDIAEKFIDKLETLGDEAEEHVEAVENLILAIEENTETIIDYYVRYVKSGKNLKGVELQKIEFAMQRMQEALKKFKKTQQELGYNVEYDI